MQKVPVHLRNLFAHLPARVIFHRVENNGFWVESPDLPGCFSAGDDLSKASENFKEAVFEYFDVPKRYAKSEILAYHLNKIPEPTRERIIVPLVRQTVELDV